MAGRGGSRAECSTRRPPAHPALSPTSRDDSLSESSREGNRLREVKYMLKGSEGAGVLTPACPNPEDSLHVTQDGAVGGDHPEVPGE